MLRNDMLKPWPFNANKLRYWLKAYIDGTRDEYKMAIQIASALDLNSVPNVMVPSENAKSRSVCRLCCASGPMTVHGRTDRQGYVPGDTIRVHVDLEEGTGRGTHDTVIKLIQTTTSLSFGDTFVYPSTVASVSSGRSLAPHSSDSWVQEVEVPPLSVSGLPGCSIIDVQYKIQIAVNIRRAAFDVKLNLPITIGSTHNSGIPPNQAQIPPGNERRSESNAFDTTNYQRKSDYSEHRQEPSLRWDNLNDRTGRRGEMEMAEGRYQGRERMDDAARGRDEQYRSERGWARKW